MMNNTALRTYSARIAAGEDREDVIDDLARELVEGYVALLGGTVDDIASAWDYALAGPESDHAIALAETLLGL